MGWWGGGSVELGWGLQGTRPMLIQQNIEELQEIPEDKLAQLLDIIHTFRVGLTRETTSPRTPGLLPGRLNDAFFEPLPEEELQQWNS